MSKVRMTILVLLGALFVLTGCNTIAGVGQDISGSARAVQHAL
ncbi:lipoprotein [Trinickia diaoshuihuensis]|jgi:predicted small secreted protein|nr:lipoprotein [Trinickia diaoshuihuensis]